MALSWRANSRLVACIRRYSFRLGKRLGRCTASPSIRPFGGGYGRIAEWKETKWADKIRFLAAVSEQVRNVFDNARQDSLPNDALVANA
jgi:hypothetical protein